MFTLAELVLLHSKEILIQWPVIYDVYSHISVAPLSIHEGMFIRIIHTQFHSSINEISISTYENKHHIWKRATI